MRPGRKQVVFRNLSTSSKLALLCGTFVIALAVAIYGLVAEKAIAIEFARKELIGTRYLDTVREFYAAILAPPGRGSADATFAALDAAETASEGRLDTLELNRKVSAALRRFEASKASGRPSDADYRAVFAAAQSLADRIGDDSNLTLDPDLDTYYLQNIAVKGLPAVLGYLGETRNLVGTSNRTRSDSAEARTRLLVLEGLIYTALSGLSDELAAGSRHTGELETQLGSKFADMNISIRSYLQTIRGNDGEQPQTVALGDGSRAFHTAVQNTLGVWAATETELERLLSARIDTLNHRLRLSLLITGALASLSIAIALMTHRHIVQPLERLEGVAQTVRETGDYSLRTDHHGHDEIGRLSLAFDDMMTELAAAREREAADQARAQAMHAEVARVSRLTTMGEMTASIAHEINQPLAAIVASANAGLRWLAAGIPDLDEARAALKRIVADGHRAGQVIKSVRAMFKDSDSRVPLDVNEIIGGVLGLLQRDLHKHRTEVRTEFGRGLPSIIADPVQLQQVILNLISNAMDAMAAVTDRQRVLRITSESSEPDGVTISVTDSGTGIDTEHKDRIFEAFFTTKSSGMGMGLSICRSIIQSHGGRLTVAAATPHGSTFTITLPGNADPA